MSAHLLEVIIRSVQEADVTQGDTVAQEIIYQQAVEDVRENRINVETHLRELKSLQLQEKKDEVAMVYCVFVYPRSLYL